MSDNSDTSWIDTAEEQVAEGLVTLSKQGSVPAANATLKLLAEQRAKAWATEHRAKVEQLQSKPIDLCTYLGELGQSNAEAALVLGRSMKPAELAALQAGAARRTIEVRAIELARLRNGDGPVRDWMTKRPRS